MQMQGLEAASQCCAAECQRLLKNYVNLFLAILDHFTLRELLQKYVKLGKKAKRFGKIVHSSQ